MGPILLLIEFLPLLLREFMANKSINPTGSHSTKPLETWGVVAGTNNQSQASIRAGGMAEGGVA